MINMAKNKIPIPKQFQIFGQTWRVEFDDKLLDDDDSIGQASFRKNLIKIQGNNAAVDRPETHKEKTFLHEVVHVIFDEIGEDDLRSNEKIVDLFANALHQILQSAEY